MTDMMPLKQCDHVVFVDVAGAHDALVSYIRTNEIIDLVFMTSDPDGSPRLHSKNAVPHKSVALKNVPYWWIPAVDDDRTERDPS